MDATEDGRSDRDPVEPARHGGRDGFAVERCGMAEVGGARPDPALTPVEARGGGPSARVAVGLVTAALAALVGISLVGQSGGRPGPQAAVAGPTAMVTAEASASPTARPVATPAPTRSPASPPGTPPRRVAASVGPVPTCPPGSTPDKSGPVAQARPPRDVRISVAFDPWAGRLVAVAGAGIVPETWTFDVCTNTWTRMHPIEEPVGVDGDDRLVYDVDSHVTIAKDRDTGRV